jgi:hypothetical protein
MSKKLIAVASVAALALSALVGIAPASAAISISNTSAGGGAGTAADPFHPPVPAENIIAAADSVAVAISANTGSTIRITTTGPVKIVDAETSTSNLYTTASGVASWVKVSTAATTTVYAYSTSTTVAGTYTVAVTEGTTVTTNTYHLKSDNAAADLYNITVTGGASTLAANGDTTYTVTGTDMFGNAVEVDYSARIESETFGDVTAVEAWNATPENVTYKLTAGATGGAMAFSIKASQTITAVAGLPDPKLSYFTTLNYAGAGDQVAALTAQLAESRSKAKSVTKKRFNTLARKWNAAFPSQAVKLKK